MKYALILFFVVNIYASDISQEDCEVFGVCDKEKFTQIVNFYNLDLRTKSIKGWVRVFNNEEKYKKYEMTLEDRIYILNCLRETNKSVKVGRIS